METDFHEQATRMVDAASPQEVRHWAIERCENKLRYEARAGAREVEIQAVEAGKLPVTTLPWGFGAARPQTAVRPLVPNREESRKAQSDRAKRVHAERKAEQKRIASTEIDMDTATPDQVIMKYPSRVHSLRLKVGSAMHGANPDRWNALTAEDKELFVRAFPAHPSIDRDGREWNDYVKTPAGRYGLELVEAGNNAALARTARRNALLNKIRFDVAVEWTRDLLTTEIALTGGVRTTWGAATADQHRLRISMLHENVVANADAANRHEAALQALADFDVQCLNDIPTQSPTQS